MLSEFSPQDYVELALVNAGQDHAKKEFKAQTDHGITARKELNYFELTKTLSVARENEI